MFVWSALTHIKPCVCMCVQRYASCIPISRLLSQSFIHTRTHTYSPCSLAYTHVIISVHIRAQPPKTQARHNEVIGSGALWTIFISFFSFDLFHRALFFIIIGFFFFAFLINYIIEKENGERTEKSNEQK